MMHVFGIVLAILISGAAIFGPFEPDINVRPFIQVLICTVIILALIRKLIRGPLRAWITGCRRIGTNLFSAICLPLMITCAVSQFNFDRHSVEKIENLYNSFGVVIPYSDSCAYVSGSLRLLYTGSLDGWNQRRPYNALLNTIMLGISGGDFKSALELRNVLVCVLIYCLGSFVLIHYGIFSAVFTTGLIFLFFLKYQLFFLSEAFGIGLGSLSAIFFISLMVKPSLLMSCTWIFTAALAQGARIGTLFVILTIPIGILYLQREAKRLLAAVLLMLAALGGFSVSFIANAAYGSQEGAFNSNFAYIAVSIAENLGSWSIAQEKYQHIVSGLSEKEASRVLLSKAAEAFVADPTNCLRALRDGFKISILFFPPKLLSLLVLSNNVLLLLLLGFTMLLCLGSLATLGLRGYREFVLLGLFLIGFVISLPFIYPDASIRATAATLPILSVFLGLSFRFDDMNDSAVGAKESLNPWLYIPAILVAFVLIPLFLPKLLSASYAKESISSLILGSETNCSDTLYVSLNSSKNSILLLKDVPGQSHPVSNSEKTPGIPVFKFTELIPEESFSAMDCLDSAVMELSLVFDHCTKSARYLLMPSHINNVGMVKATAGMVRQDPRIMCVRSYSVLDPSLAESAPSG